MDREFENLFWSFCGEIEKLFKFPRGTCNRGNFKSLHRYCLPSYFDQSKVFRIKSQKEKSLDVI